MIRFVVFLVMPTPSSQLIPQFQRLRELRLMIAFRPRTCQEDGASSIWMVDEKSACSVQGNVFPVSR